MQKLYHYTSSETLYKMFQYSIFTDQETRARYLKMWATHICYLNDETERKLFSDMLIKNIIQYSELQGSSLTEDQRKEIKQLCNTDTFIISLSELQDDLNMWRGYGGNGIGVNIEFDLSHITPYYSTSIPNHFKTEKVYKVHPCTYHKPEDCKIEESLVRNIYTYITQTNHNSFMGATLIKQIEDLSTIYKHDAYQEEKEWRFIIDKSYPFKYIYSNRIIKPYIEFPIPLEAITAITIGPCIKSNYEIKSIEQFIKAQMGDPNFNVRYSKIPYRS